MKKEKKEAIITEFKTATAERAITAVADAMTHTFGQESMTLEEAQDSSRRFAEYIRLLMQTDAVQKAKAEMK